MYGTGLSSDEVKKLRVNSAQTIEDQQKMKRRPHIRIIDEVINKTGLKPTCIFNIRRFEIVETVEGVRTKFGLKDMALSHRLRTMKNR